MEQQAYFDHPRHDLASSQTITQISFEHLNELVIQNPTTWRRDFKSLVVISCFDRFYNFDYLFGDWIDFDKSQGLYSAPTFQPAFDAIRELSRAFHRIFLISPQPRPQSSFIDDSNIFYIEIPEFYGIYARWFSQGYDGQQIEIDVKRHFLFLNKRNRPGRQLLFYLVHQTKLLDKGFVSFLGHGPGYDTMFSREIFANTHELLRTTNPTLSHVDKEILDILPYSNNPLMTIKDETMGTGGWLPDHQLYEQSFVSVIGETHESLNGATVLTEKVFRCIWFKRPFLILGGSGYLLELRKLGFKTFSRWFDESYDLDPNLFGRVELVHRELVKICTLRLTECNNILREMTDVLEHNKQNLIRLNHELPTKLAHIDQFILSKDLISRPKKVVLQIKNR